MIKNSNVKLAVWGAAAPVTFADSTERLMVCCILYKFMMQLVLNNDAEANNMKATASSYMNLYRDKVQKLNGTYISYKVMRNIIINSGYTNFLYFSENLINEVYEAYTDHTRIEKFAVHSFSQYMYQIRNLNYKQHQRLSRIHYNTMAPIAKYYYDKYGISPTCLQISNAEGIEDNPGKEIIFMISGVSSSKILADLVSRKINSDYYSATIKGDYVRLVTN